MLLRVDRGEPQSLLEDAVAELFARYGWVMAIASASDGAPTGREDEKQFRFGGAEIAGRHRTQCERHRRAMRLYHLSAGLLLLAALVGLIVGSRAGTEGNQAANLVAMVGAAAVALVAQRRIRRESQTSIVAMQRSRNGWNYRSWT